MNERWTERREIDSSCCLLPREKGKEGISVYVVAQRVKNAIKMEILQRFGAISRVSEDRIGDIDLISLSYLGST